jgi:hypothetical protein
MGSITAIVTQIVTRNEKGGIFLCVNFLISLVEPGGIEPPTSCLQSRRSPTELRPHERGYMARKLGMRKLAQRGARAAMKASRARRRWLMACFSAAVISAKVRVSPSGTKIGS